MKCKDTGINDRRIFASLHRLATVAEELRGHPDTGEAASQIDTAGRAICHEIADAFEVGEETRERIFQAYPAVKEQSGEAFREGKSGDTGEEEPVAEGT